MGQLRFALYKISKLIPKNYRRPVILISSFLGLIIFFQVMAKMTGSPFLLSLQELFMDMWTMAQKEGIAGQIIVFACILIAFLGYRYYSKLQNIISIGYVIVLLLSILPLILKI